MITDIKVKQKSRVVEVSREDGSKKTLDFATLRRTSPAADNSSTSEDDYSHINITAVVPVGNYGVRFVFDDGHDTGIFRFEELNEGARFTSPPKVD